jgi:uncharacterized BrkB/YihY/UPF0761 family membrane protein
LVVVSIAFGGIDAAVVRFVGIGGFSHWFCRRLGAMGRTKNFLNTDDIPLLMMARWTLSFALMYATVAILYNAGNRIKKRWEWFSIGATAATTCCSSL